MDTHTTQLTDAEMELLHGRGFRNRAEVTRSTECACFYCRERFPPGNVREWADKGETAMCPRCGIDSVIGDGGTPEGRVSDDVVAQMRTRWFDTPATESLSEMALGELVEKVSAMSPEEVSAALARVDAALAAKAVPL